MVTPRLGCNQVGQRRVPQLVQRPPDAMRVVAGRSGLEQVLGTRVGQAASPGGGVDVGGRGHAAPAVRGAPAGEEHRTGGSAVEEAGQ